MSLAVDEPILNNPFEEPREYWIYDELVAVEKKIEGYHGELEGGGTAERNSFII